MDILQNSSFMFFFIITFIIFLILYMWRKIASLESYVFILEKRVNNIKKDISIGNKNSKEDIAGSCNDNKCSNESKCYINDIIMNEVFGNNKNIQSYQTIDLPVPNSAGENINIEYEDNSVKVDDDIDNVLNSVLDVKKSKIQSPQQQLTSQTSPPQPSQTSPPSPPSPQSQPSPIPSVIASTINVPITELKKEEKTDAIPVANIIPEKKDEECSEATLSKKKIKTLPIDALKELCISNNLSTEGTRAILIERLLTL